MGLYNDYCCSNFGLRYYAGYQFWILRFFQPPAEDFYDQYSIVMAGNQSLSNCSCGLIDFRDLSFLNHSEAFHEVVDHSFTQLEVKKKYAVLCNTPIESAFFYLLPLCIISSYSNSAIVSFKIKICHSIFLRIRCYRCKPRQSYCQFSIFWPT